MIHFQIEDYLKKKLIYMYQPGFRADQSLDFCLSLSHWTTFDILDHKIHFEKAKYSSFQASLIKRFESCPSNKHVWFVLKISSRGWNIKAWCTTRLYSGTAPCSFVNDLQSWSEAGPIYMWMILVCFTSMRMFKTLKILKMKSFRHYASGS